MTNKEAIKIIQYGLIDENFPVVRNVGEEVLNMAIKALEDRPTGYWKDIGVVTWHGCTAFECSNCHECDERDETETFVPFCKYCGAKMEKKE